MVENQTGKDRLDMNVALGKHDTSQGVGNLEILINLLNIVSSKPLKHTRGDYSYIGVVNAGCYRRAMIKQWVWLLTLGDWAKSVRVLSVMKVQNTHIIWFWCPLYDDIRKALIPKCYLNRPSMYNRIILFDDVQKHYNFVIMNAMASEITGAWIVFPRQGNIKAPRQWPLWGHKGPVTQNMTLMSHVWKRRS